MAQTPLSPLEKFISEQPKPQAQARGVFAETGGSGRARNIKANPIPPELVPVIAEAARVNNVPANVLASMADQESNFNDSAVGVATQWGKAKGIMQYLDDTAKNSGINSLDAKQSINMAAQQLRERLDKGYDIKDAVREHFAGPNRRQWGSKTAAYGDEVIERAGQYMDAFGTPEENSPEAAPEGGYTAEYAQELLNNLNREEPGRFVIATPEQVAQFEREAGAGLGPNDMLPGMEADGVKPPAEQDGALSAIGKTLRNIPGNFQEAAAGQLRSFGEGVDDQTLVSQAANAGIIDQLRESGIITMQPSRTGLRKQDVPTFADGRRVDTATLAQYLRENGDELLAEDFNGAAGNENRLTELGAELGADARKDRLEVNPNGPLAKYSSMIIGSTAEMIPALVAAAVTKKPSIAMGMIGGQVYGQSYERARTNTESPQNPSEAASYAMAQAAAEAIPSALPVHAILAPGKNFFSGLFKASAAEAVQESITGAIQAGIDKGTIDPNMTWEQAGQQIFDGMVAGAGSGAALRAGTVGARRARDAMRSPERDLGNALNESVESTELPGDAQQAAVDALDPNTRAAETPAPAFDQATGEVIGDPAPTAQPQQPQGPLSRAASVIAPPEPMAPTAQVQGSAMTPDAGADAFAGQPGTLLNIEMNGVEPFRARLEGYVDGEAMLIDDAGDRFQMTREELAGARVIDEGSPTIAADTGEQSAVEQVIEQDGEPPLLTEVVEPPLLTEVVEPAPAKVEAPVPAANPKPAEKTAERAKAKPIEEQTEAELRASLKYLAGQAKSTGGWSKPLILERRKIEAAISSAAKAETVVDESATNVEKTASNVKESASDAKEVASDVAQSASPVTPASPVGKWFGSKAKADGYIAGKGIGGTHHSVRRGLRYEIVERAATEDSSAVQSPATKAENAQAAPPRKNKESPSAYRARVQIGTDAGGTVTPSADIGYAPGGETYTVLRIDDGGTVYVESDKGRTSWSRAELQRAKSQGVEFSPTEPPAKEPKAVKPTKAGKAVETTQAQPVVGVSAVRGEPINNKWTAFNAASGTRWIPRAEMPQVKAEHRGALVNYLNARGIEHSEVEVPAGELKATQAEYSPDRVQRAKEFDGGQRAILISSDNHVVDGHHQWLASLDMGETVRAIQLDAPIDQVLEQVRDFPSATTSKGADPENNPQEKPAERPGVQITENKVFTEDAAAKARALLKSKLTQLNSGIDPEIMQAGITLAGYHIEKGARTFSAYAKAMTADLGDVVRPYLKSWYAGIRYDPRAAGFDGMSTMAEVDAFDVDTITTEETTNVPSVAERMERDSRQPAVAEPVNANPDGDAGRADAERAGDPGVDAGEQRSAGQRDKRVPSDGPAAGRERGNQRVHQRDGKYQPSQRTAGGAERAGGRDNRNSRPAVERKRAKQIARNAVTAGAGELAQRLKAQKAASKAPTTWADPTSIDAALPLLLPEQRGDVLKAEVRLANANGILYTNGTGTGKTASGAGIAKRYYNAGKKDIIVVVPSDKIASDWIKFAEMLDLPLAKLDGTSDNGGSGPVVTTYANFGQNKTLAKRQWDLVIPDESHYLSSNEGGESTAALDQLRALTGHHAGMDKWMEGRYAGAYALREKTHADLMAAEAREAPPATIDSLSAKHQEANAAIKRLRDRLEPRWRQRWEGQQGVGKVAFLSATPFAYQKNVQYAEGYLFDYAPPAELYRKEGMSSQAYNAGSAYDNFMMQHFGYRMRYNKLTQPEAGVDSQIMERQFNNWLKSQGALSGRKLEVEHDYDRKFITVDDAIGTKIDDALRFLREGDEGAHRKVYDAVMKSFDYQSRMYLLEALKARALVPIVREQLAAGRKVVVFHDYNKGGADNPFSEALRNIKDPELKDRANKVLSKEMFRFDMGGLKSPLETMGEAFPGALLFNGTVSKAKRRKNADTFNDDASGPAVIVVQSDAGREGVSLHDTTGEYPRVMYNLGMPTKPVAATQIEGRTYRTGQASNAQFRYLTTGTGWEASAFASKIAERASTAENLALGEESRDLKQAFIDAYTNAEAHSISETDGRGGKERDRGLTNSTSPFDRAKSFYWAQARNTKRRDQREGADYFATAEPVGFKKVQWADIKPGESVLEPSAGHGAIARFFPEQADVTMIEPSYDLSQRAALANGAAKIVNDTFESHHVANKYSAIVMNPPFGSGGKTAIEHLTKAARHLSEGGRIVATIPRGGMADRRLDAFFADPAHANLHTVADIELPDVAFERAGTAVASRILVLERHAGENVPIQPMKVDLTGAKDVGELFDRIENLDLPERLPLKPKASLLDGSGINGNRYDAPTLDKALRSGPLGEVIAPLLDNGRVVIHESAPAGIHGLTQGWTDTDGSIHLVAEQLTSDTAQPVLLHEAFHTGVDALANSPRWTNLMGRLNGFYKSAAAGKMKGEWADAYRRVQGAMDAGDGMSQLRAIEELGAYSVENFENAPAGVKKWVDSVLGVIKEWLSRRFGIQAGAMTPAQLRAMAVSALRSGSVAPRAEMSRSVAGTGATPPSDKQVDSWFSSKLTDAMAGPKSSGQYSILALAPMDRLVEELTRDGSSARKYLTHKRDMDAYRNGKHKIFDDIAQEWLKLNTNPATKKAAEQMAVLMHDATIAQIDPAKPLEATLTPKERQIVQDQPDSALAKQIMRNMEAKRPDYNDLRDRFLALPERVRRQYITVRNTYKAMTEELDQIIADNLAAAVELTIKRAEREHKATLEEINDDGLTGQDRTDAIDAANKKYQTAVTKGRMNKKARLTMLRQKFESNRLNGPYFPLARFGDYFVTVRDGDGKVLNFSRFESERDQKRFARRQAGKGKVETGLLSNSEALKGAVDPRFIADIEQILGKADINDSVRDQVWQRYLESMPDMSLRKGFIHRKNREGYTQDATRAFAHKMFHGAHQMGRLKYGNQLQEAVEDAQVEARLTNTPERDMAVANELARRHEYVMNPKGGATAQALTSAAFIYQLSMSPAAALVNLAQTVMVGVPVIGAQYGMAKTAAELGKASADFAMGRGQAARSKSLTAEERAAMQNAYQSGLIESTQSHNLAGVGDGVGVRYSAVRNKVMGVIAWAFHQTERLNREVTYLAAYRMARKAGETHDQAMSSATSLTYKTHFDYGNCVDDQTECLTVDGWKTHDQLAAGDRIISVDDNGRAVEISVQDVSRFYGRKEICLMSAKGVGRRLTMAMTDDHKCIVQRQKRAADGKREWAGVEFVEAQNLKSSQWLLRTPTNAIEGRKGGYGKDFAALLGWIAAEGWYAKNRGAKVARNVRIEQSIVQNLPYVDEINGLLERIGLPHSRHAVKQGCHILWSFNAELSGKIQQEMPDKLLTWSMVKRMDAEEMAACLDAFCKADGAQRGKGGAWTIGQAKKNAQNLEVLQAMATMLGRNAALSSGEDLSTLILGAERGNKYNRVQVRNLEQSRITVDMVWCPTTDNGRWVARRDGRVFVTGNTNRPRVMHGDTAKVLLVFRNYQVNMLWRLFRDTHQAVHGDKEAKAEAVKQLAGMTGMMALNAGVKGVWLYSIGMMIASMLFGDDAEDEFKKGTIELLGPTAAGLLLNGVPGHVTGLALSERIGMPDLWFRSPDRQMEGKEEFTYWQSQLLGFLPTIAQNMFVGYQQAKNDNIARGVETASPKFIKDLMRAYRYGSEGATTLRGDQVVSDFKAGEIFAQAMGFTPAVLAEQYDRNSQLKNAESKIMDKRSKLLSKFAAATKTKDVALREEVKQQIREFNRENKRVAITPANMTSSVRSRKLRGERTEGGIYINPKLDKQLRDNIAPAIYR